MGTPLTPVDSFDSVISPNPGEPVRASGAAGSIYVFVGADNNGTLIYTPNAGNVRVRQLGGVSQTLAVTVVGGDITVQLGTNAGGAVTSRGIDVANAFNAVGAATTLASITTAGTGLGLAAIWSNFMSLTDDPIGSVRPPLQSLTNNTYWLKHGVVEGARTVTSGHASGTGGNASAALSGEFLANVAFQSALSAVEGIRLESYRLIFRHTGNTGVNSNPPRSTSLKNELRALTLNKCFGTVITDGTGGFSVLEGSGYSAAIAGGQIVITMLTAMDDANYTVTNTIDLGSFVKPTSAAKVLSATQFQLRGQENLLDINPATTVVRYMFNVLGRQTTV